MSDHNLRVAIALTAASYETRGDQHGDLIARVLRSILRSAELFDKVEKDVEEEEPK